MGFDAYEQLAVDPGAVGDVARSILETPSQPGESYADTQYRSAQQAGATARIQAIKGKQWAARGVPSYQDMQGNTKPVVDDTGSPLSKLDPKHNIAYDSTGSPKKIDFDVGSGSPVLKDPFEGLETTTDPKTGHQYKIAPGLPWRWVGTDAQTAQKADFARQDANLSKASAALGRKLTLTEYDEKFHRDAINDVRSQLKQLSVADTDPVTGDPLDYDSLVAGINSQFDGQKNDKNWAGNEKEYFGMGGYKPEALKAQADLELQRAAALRAAAKGHAHAQTLDGIRQQAEAVRAQRMMIEQTKLDHETEILKAQGIDISQPPVPQLDPSGAVQPEQPTKITPDAKPAARGAAGAIAKDAPPITGGGVKSEGLVGDLGRSLASGGFSILKMAGDLWGLATGDMDNFASELGKEASENIRSTMTDKQRSMVEERTKAVKAAPDNLGKAWEFVKHTLANPRLLLTGLTEQVPQFVGPGLIGNAVKFGTGKILLKGAASEAAEKIAIRKAIQYGRGAAVGTGAAMQGADLGANQYDEMMANLAEMPATEAANIPEIAELMDRGATLDDAKLAFSLTLARKTGALAGAISLASQFLPGAQTIEKAIVGKAGKEVVGKAVTKGMIRRGVEGAAGEAVQEMVEEGGGLIGKNKLAQAVDPNRSLTEGLGETLAQAALTAGPMGAVAGAMHGSPTAPENGTQPPDAAGDPAQVPPPDATPPATPTPYTPGPGEQDPMGAPPLEGQPIESEMAPAQGLNVPEFQPLEGQPIEESPPATPRTPKEGGPMPEPIPFIEEELAKRGWNPDEIARMTPDERLQEAGNRPTIKQDRPTRDAVPTTDVTELENLADEVDAEYLGRTQNGMDAFQDRATGDKFEIKVGRVNHDRLAASQRERAKARSAAPAPVESPQQFGTPMSAALDRAAGIKGQQQSQAIAKARHSRITAIATQHGVRYTGTKPNGREGFVTAGGTHFSVKAEDAVKPANVGNAAKSAASTEPVQAKPTAPPVQAKPVTPPAKPAAPVAEEAPEKKRQNELATEVQRQLREVHGDTLKALGKQTRAVVAPNTMTGRSGLITKDGIIHIDPVALDKALSVFDTQKEKDAFLERAINEEVKHAQTVAFAQSDKTNRDRIIALNDTEKEIAEGLKKQRSDWDNLSAEERGHEIFRVLLQAHENPSNPQPTTESTWQLIGKFVEWLKAHVKNLSPSSKKLLSDLEAWMAKRKQDVAEQPESPPKQSAFNDAAKEAFDGLFAEAPTKEQQGKNFAKWREESAIRRKALAESVDEILRAAGTEGGVLLEPKTPRSTGTKLTVTPDNGGYGKEGWRVTQWDNQGPYGHFTFESREAALRAVGGESHTKLVPGPPYFSFGPYKVVRVTKREGGILHAEAPTLQQKPIPEGKDAAFLTLATTALKDGATTPEALGKMLVDFNPAARAYSQAVWSMMAARKPELAGSPDWNMIYEGKDSEFETPTYTVAHRAPGSVPFTEQEMSPKDIHLSEDVPNIKEKADPVTGVVPGQELSGEYDRGGGGNRIVVWQRTNGRNEVITGRHRRHLAIQNDVKAVPVQVFKESDGFTKDMAVQLDAESNIRDGQGDVSDYANYFRHSKITSDEASSRGLLARHKGRAGYAIGKNASDDLYALYRAEKIGDAKAAAIATTAPGDQALQQIGIKYALKGESAAYIVNVMKAATAGAQEKGTQIDLFGNDDSAMVEMERRADTATKMQQAVRDRINAVRGAVKRPEAAAEMGVDVKDVEGTKKEIARLEEESARWDNWPMHKDLVAKVKGDEAKPEKKAEPEKPAAPAKEEAPVTEYAYGMRNRPRQIGAQPKDFSRVDENDKRGRHGVIFYNRKLTADEIYSFELEDLSAKEAAKESADEFLAKLDAFPLGEKENIRRTIEADPSNPSLEKWKKQWLDANEKRRAAKEPLPDIVLEFENGAKVRVKGDDSHEFDGVVTAPGPFKRGEPQKFFVKSYMGEFVYRADQLTAQEPAAAEALKDGDDVVFTPTSKRDSVVKGKLVESIKNTSGEPGYHILAPLPGDPGRIVRVWKSNGSIEKAEPAAPEVKPLPAADEARAQVLKDRLKKKFKGLEAAKPKNRLQQLHAAAQERALTLDEQAERDTLERAEGQGFMDFAAPITPGEVAAKKEADIKAKAKAAIEFRLNRKLVGGNIETQTDAFGPQADEGGNLSLFAEKPSQKVFDQSDTLSSAKFYAGLTNPKIRSGLTEDPKESVARHNAKAEALNKLDDEDMLTEDAMDAVDSWRASDVESYLWDAGEKRTIAEMERDHEGDTEKEEWGVSKPLFDWVKAAHPETEDIRTTGYVLPDGEKLSFSHDGRSRDQDHREIDWPRKGEDSSSGTGKMIAMMNAGAMRIDANSGNISLRRPPTGAQEKAIMEVADHAGEAHIDAEIAAPDGYGEKERDSWSVGPEDVADAIKQIRSFYRTGKSRPSRLFAEAPEKQKQLEFAGEIFTDAVQLGAHYIQTGSHRFTEWAEKMREDCGPQIEKYLKSIYETAKVTIESPRGESVEGRPPGLERGLRPPTERIVTARAEHTQHADESVIPDELKPHLDEHQRQGAAAGIASMEKIGGFLNADGTGAGKTRQALTVASHFAKQGKRVVIVTKAETIKQDWKKNTFGGSYGFDSKAMGIPLDLVRDGNVKPGKIGITTYQNLSDVDRNSGPDTVLIFDEAHALKNDSQQAKYGMSATQKASKVMFMSATPADKAEHIYYLAGIGIMEGKTVQKALEDLGMKLITVKKRDKNGRQYEVKFWAPDGRVSDTARNARFSALFNRMTAKGAMIKREISMEGVHVNMLRVSLPPEGHDVQQDILRFFDAAHIDDLQGLKRAIVLGHMRRQQEPFKIASTVMLAQREMEQGRQVVIFVSRVNASEVGKWVKGASMPGMEAERYREILMSSEGTAKSLAEAMRDAGIHDIAEIHGNADQNSLDAMADFQSGKKRVVIATIESGGTGINLDDILGNRPRSMIIVTAPFDAVGNVQAAGRIWRLKTMSGANLFYLFGNTDVDEWNKDIIGSKMAMLGAVVEGQVRKLDVSDPEQVSLDDFRSSVAPVSNEGSPRGEMPEGNAFPTLDWRPFKTRAGKDKFVADATPEFWKWWKANGERNNSEGVSLNKWDGKWQVWSDREIGSTELSAAAPERGPKDEQVPPDIQAVREKLYAEQQKRAGRSFTPTAPSVRYPTEAELRPTSETSKMGELQRKKVENLKAGDVVNYADAERTVSSVRKQENGASYWVDFTDGNSVKFSHGIELPIRKTGTLRDEARKGIRETQGSEAAPEAGALSGEAKAAGPKPELKPDSILHAAAPERKATDAVAAGAKGRDETKEDRKAAQAATFATKPPGVASQIWDAIKTAGSATKRWWGEMPAYDTIDKAIGQWLGAGDSAPLKGTDIVIPGRQKAAHESRKLVETIVKQFPNVLTRQAISRYMEADGDKTTLQKWADKSKPEMKTVYERALNLNAAEKAMADTAKTFFKEKGEEAQKLGLLGNLLENYVTHFVEKAPANQRSGLMARILGDLASDTPASKLKTKFDHAIKRVFSSMFDLEQEGHSLRGGGDIAGTLGAYAQAANNTVADRVFVKSLTDIMARDGRPMAVPSGAITRTDGSADSPLLIKPHTHPADTSDYRPISHPALRKWKWIGKEGEKDVLVEGELLIHPDLYKRLKNTLGTSALNNVPIIKAVGEFQGIVKQLMLSFSPFHFVQEGTHAIGHKVNPFKVAEIDMDDPATRELVNAGLMLANWNAKAEFGEGLTANGMEKLLSHIGLGKLGKLNDTMSAFLFEKYIPGLKIAMAKEAMVRNMERFKKDLASGKMTREQVAQKTAQQANDAFGEQNNLYAGNNPTRLHAERLLFLAPDFLKSRAKFFADAFRKHGKEQRNALILLAVVLAVTAKLLERMLTGKNDWEKPFSVVTDDREYELRSVPGDVIAMLKNTRQFVMGRISPLISRTALEAATGRDWRGQQRSAGQQVKDLAMTPLPLALRGVIDPEAPDISMKESLISSSGLRTIRHSEITKARKLGREWQKANGSEHVDEVHPPSKYVGIKNALEDGDNARAMKEYGKLLATMPKEKADTGFRSSLMKPFSGSLANEKAFVASLDADDRATYQAAMTKRGRMLAAFTRMSATTRAPANAPRAAAKAAPTRSRALTAKEFFR
jgi:hypothetical protein